MEVNLTISVFVQEVHKNWSIFSGDFALLFDKPRIEFLSIQFVIAIERIEAPEDTSKWTYGLGPSLDELVLQILKD